MLLILSLLFKNPHQTEETVRWGSFYLIFLLVQLRACRNMIIHHEQVQLLFAVLLAYCGQQHTTGLNAHHGSGGQIGDGDQGLAYQFFRLIVSVDTGEDGAVGAGAVIQSEL